MITGLMTHKTGVMFNTNSFQIEHHESMGVRMKKAGYETAYIGKWHIPLDSSNSKWTGFDLMMEGTRKFNDRHFSDPVSEFLRKKHDKPFFMVASFVNPHDICEYARKLTGGFSERQTELWNGSIANPPAVDQMPSLPDNFEISENEPDIIRKHQSWIPGVYPSKDWSKAQWREYRWALNRMTERVDSEIAKILETLHAEGLDQNTIVVLVSDHGDGYAEHRWNQKTVLYDSIVRVPLIISGPGIAVPGRTDRTHLVSSGLDLFPTFCDYAEVEPPQGLNGLSLRPLVEGRATAWRDEVTSECSLHRLYGQGTGIEGRMLRTQQYKYMVYSAGRLREQLFDLHSDPGEMTNLAVLPHYKPVLEEHRRRLAKHIEKTKDYFIVPGTSYDEWYLNSIVRL